MFQVIRQIHGEGGFDSEQLTPELSLLITIPNPPPEHYVSSPMYVSWINEF